MGNHEDKSSWDEAHIETALPPYQTGTPQVDEDTFILHNL